MKTATAAAILIMAVLSGTALAGPSPLFATGSLMEVDRLASAWLIKRWIEPDAEFLFVPDGQLITRGTAFDTPDARFCRTHNKATFELLLAHYKIKDPRLSILAGAVHEVEINYWAGGESHPLAAGMAREIRDIISANPDPVLCLGAALTYFDRLFDQLSVKDKL